MSDKMNTVELEKRIAELEKRVRELKEAESEREARMAVLKESEKRFRELIENAPVGIFRTTSQGRTLSVNSSLSRYLGFSSPQEAIRYFHQLGHQLYHSPERRDQFIWLLRQYGFVENFEYRARTVDGRMLWLSMNAKVIEYFPDGSFTIEGFASDVTKRKIAEETLKEREAQLRTLIDTLPDLVWLKDEQGMYLFCNSRFENFFGAKEKDIVGKTDYDFVNKELADYFRKYDRAAIEEEKPTRNEEEVKFAADGHREILETINTPMYTNEGQLVGVLGIGRDITERKHSEAELKRRMEFERLLARISSELAAIGVNGADSAINYSLATIGAFTGADRAYVFQFSDDDALLMDNTYRWFADGIAVGKVRNKPIAIDRQTPWFAEHLRARKIFHVPNVADLPPQAWKERDYLDRQAIKSLVVVPMETANGLIGFLGFDTVTSCRFWTEDDQRLLQFLGETLSHVIERNLAEKEQERLKLKLSQTIEMAHLGPWEFDAVNDHFIFNDHFYKIFKATAGQVGGYIMSSADYADRFVHPEDRYVVSHEIQKALKSNDPNFTGQLEHRMLYTDGTVGYLSIKYFTIKNDLGQTIKIFGVNQDITERKHAEEKLRESEEKLIRLKKMESIGLLAGGVAHDLNNILSGLVSYPELILMTLPADSKLRKPIQTIQSSGHKAVAIVQDLLTVARGVAIEKHPLNINDAIEDYMRSPVYEKLLQSHPGVEVSAKLDPRLMNIKGSLVHIGKAVMNLVSNAAEAIADTGVVAISTQNQYIDRPLKGYDDVKVGEYAVLTVSDNGPGIADSDLERIFEPFYTKKIMGRSGTGLGLAVVWNVVQDHHGYIDVAADERGTAFKLYFPITREEMLKEEKNLSLEDYMGHGERVLVVDDVESQRELFCMMLDTLGYHAHCVSSGEEAVSYLEKNSADIILLDMIMDPGINGRETYERIIKSHPGQKAIIVSGFADTDEVRKAQELGAGKYLKKPVQLEKLGMTLKLELGFQY